MIDYVSQSDLQIEDSVSSSDTVTQIVLNKDDFESVVSNMTLESTTEVIDYSTQLDYISSKLDSIDNSLLFIVTIGLCVLGIVAINRICIFFSSLV